MIGLILGTSEGRKILSLLNNYTSDILVSTATEYGGEILKNYKYEYLNTNPLDFKGLVNLFKEKGVNLLVDASHPYAVEISKNAIKACEELNIEYVRYERLSSVDRFKNEEKIVEVKDYDDLYDKLKNIEGNILNTTGSRNLDKILSMKINNRIIHRVLPSVKVMQECIDKGLDAGDIIAIKGPISYELNCTFINEYKAQAMLLKDSGVEGGTEGKLKACIDNNIYGFVIGRKSVEYKNVFYTPDDLVKYISDNFIL
ncbi:cobalt-precorrin-6A reductase [Clostridiaceae bacterium UIB06]|uniref:Cobalt-precorrin-6A reductase n=1 Tax=Clostridium thailandense TaxID=2794346 RepID=A0A949TLV2_9CLOT|nr:cobalt-precorrin-6A reductase [Clostridium thailandense]MBV7275259.1 cobalt-precorrin-6A reductase [Clostridium thailandense]MCH5137770.1 cobalt-precorrin-6A reductase [Clostridiaceae bacterium UIB06]